MSTAERFKSIRKHLKLTQEEFGTHIGLSKHGVQKTEKGNNNPSKLVMLHLKDKFSINTEWLLTGEGEMFLPEVKDKANDLWQRKKEEYEIGDEAVAELLKVVDAETKIEIFEAIASLNSAFTVFEEGEDPEIVAEYISKLSSLMRLLTSFLYRINEFSFDYITDDLNLEKFDLDYRDYEIRSKQIIMEIFNVLCGNVGEEEEEETIQKVTPLNRPTVGKEESLSYSSCNQVDSYDLVAEQEPEYNVTKRVPVAGNVAAGNAIEIYNHFDDLIDVPGSMTVDYVLNVKGNSMEPLIADGSLVFVKQQDDLDQGDIGIFMIDDSKVTCKRYHRNNGNVVLRSENKDYPDMVFGPKSNIRILGKVVLTKNE